MIIRRHSRAALVATALFATTVTFGALGCGSTADSHAPGAASETLGHAQMTLTTVGKHATYRLGPAAFLIESTDPAAPLSQTINADGSQDKLDVPLPRGVYKVTLQPDWQLQSSVDSAPFVPLDATLTSTNPQTIWVEDFETANVQFNFVLGRSGMEIGIGVDEGNHLPPGVVPAGYDGVIERMSDGRYDILFDNGGGACCFASVEEAKAAYPQYRFFVR